MQRRAAALKLLAERLNVSTDSLNFNVLFYPSPRKYLLKQAMNYKPEPVPARECQKLYGLRTVNGEFVELFSGKGES